MKFVLKYLIPSSLLVFALFLLVFLIVGEKNIVDYAFTHISKNPSLGRFLIKTSAQKHFIIFLFLIFSLIAISVLIFKNHSKIKGFIFELLQTIRKNIGYAYKSITLPEVIIFLIPILSSLYFALSLPISYDEAYTYLNFSSRGIFTAISTYPVPNNHVLNSAITNFFHFIPFLGTTFLLRLPIILESLLTLVILYHFLKEFYSKNVALLTVGISSMLFMSIYYSYMARGYELIVLFFTISLFATFKIVLNKDPKNAWIIYCVSNTLGFYAIPSFLYPFIMLNLIILLNNYKSIIPLVKFGVLTIIAVVILYSPIIVRNGIGVLIHNKFVVPIKRDAVIKGLPHFFANTMNELVGFNCWPIVILFAVSGVILVRKKMFLEVSMLLVFLVMPAVLLIAQSVLPFARTFNFYSIILILLPVLAFRKQIEKINYPYLLLLLIPVQIALSYNFYTSIKPYETFNIEYNEVYKKTKGGSTYYIASQLFEKNFSYELRAERNHSAKAISVWPTPPLNADTMLNYNYIIIDIEYDSTAHRKPFYAGKYIKVYSNK